MCASFCVVRVVFAWSFYSVYTRYKFILLLSWIQGYLHGALCFVLDTLHSSVSISVDSQSIRVNYTTLLYAHRSITLIHILILTSPPPSPSPPPVQTTSTRPPVKYVPLTLPPAKPSLIITHHDEATLLSPPPQKNATRTPHSRAKPPHYCTTNDPRPTTPHHITPLFFLLSPSPPAYRRLGHNRV